MGSGGTDPVRPVGWWHVGVVGGSASGTTISSGGLETVVSGAVIANIDVLAGRDAAAWDVSRPLIGTRRPWGGTAYNVSALNGARSSCSAAVRRSRRCWSAPAPNTSGFFYDSNETVSSGGSSFGTVVSSGGQETVLSGAVSSDTVVYQGGSEQLGAHSSNSVDRRSKSRGGTAYNVSAISGGQINVSAVARRCRRCSWKRHAKRWLLLQHQRAGVVWAAPRSIRPSRAELPRRC